jgi:hypothetical protein
VFADINSQSKGEYRDNESVEGLSSIMHRSAIEGTDRKLVDEDDVLHIYNDIKELFRKAFSFEDLLAKMGKPELTKENMVTFKDFETLVKSFDGGHRFSSMQVRTVFNNYAFGKNAVTKESYISLVEFKDKFYPGIHW